MNSATERHRRRFRFSLSFLLCLMTLIAVGSACWMAHQEKQSLVGRVAELEQLSSRLLIGDGNQLMHVALPRVADDYHSWQVFVPEQGTYQLRLGVGEVSRQGVPAEFDGVLLTPGRHRITAFISDNVKDGYRFSVMVDGETVIDQKREKVWMPYGWSQSSGISWPRSRKPEDRPAVQMIGRSYLPRIETKKNQYFNAQSDDWVTRPGYRLWIDQMQRSYDPPSPFIGVGNEPSYQGIGLRDGIRYRSEPKNVYAWTLTRPASATNRPVLNLCAEFDVDGQLALSEDTKPFEYWNVRKDAIGKEARRWEDDPTIESRSAFLHADLGSSERIAPVVELKWDVTRPDSVGLSLPNVPANAGLTRWRLRFRGGATHLWRRLSVQDLPVKAGIESDDDAETLRSIELPPETEGDYHIGWKTDVEGPLQFLLRGAKRPNPFSALDLYKGLPVKFGITIPSSFDPTVRVSSTRKSTDGANVVIPGGPVIDELQIELDANANQWIWITVKPL